MASSRGARRGVGCGVEREHQLHRQGPGGAEHALLVAGDGLVVRSDRVVLPDHEHDLERHRGGAAPATARQRVGLVAVVDPRPVRLPFEVGGAVGDGASVVVAHGVRLVVALSGRVAVRGRRARRPARWRSTVRSPPGRRRAGPWRFGRRRGPRRRSGRRSGRGHRWRRGRPSRRWPGASAARRGGSGGTGPAATTPPSGRGPRRPRRPRGRAGPRGLPSVLRQARPADPPGHPGDEVPDAQHGERDRDHAEGAQRDADEVGARPRRRQDGATGTRGPGPRWPRGAGTTGSSPASRTPGSVRPGAPTR